MTLQYCISGVTNPIENHSCSIILPLLNIRDLRIPTIHGTYFVIHTISYICDSMIKIFTVYCNVYGLRISD